MKVHVQTPKLKIGDPAPDVTLHDDTSMERPLSELWQRKPLALVFTRHLGCPLCRAHAVSLRDQYAEVQSSGGEIGLVTMGLPSDNAPFRKRFALPFTLLSDPDRVAYKAYGVPRGSVWNVAGTSVWSRGFRSLRRFGVGRIIGDPYQLPGTFIVDQMGILRFVQFNKTSADWAAGSQLIEVFRGLLPVTA